MVSFMGFGELHGLALRLPEELLSVGPLESASYFCGPISKFIFVLPGRVRASAPARTRALPLVHVEDNQTCFDQACL